MKLNTFLVFRLLAHIYFEVDLKIHFEEAEDMVSDQAPWFITVFSKLFFSWVCQHGRPVTLKLDRFYSWEYLLFLSPALDWKILLKIVTARHIILLFLFCLPFFFSGTDIDDPSFCYMKAMSSLYQLSLTWTLFLSILQLIPWSLS